MTIQKTEVECRITVWEAISELWVDNELDIPWIAQTLINSGHTKQELEEIYAYEVSPVVWKNFGFLGLNPIPAVWSGFDSNWLTKVILDNIKKQSQSVLYRIYVRSKIGVWIRTSFVKDDWKKLIRIIENSKEV